MIGRRSLLFAILALATPSAWAICPYDANCINNPFTGRNPVPSQGGPAVAPFGRYSPNQLNPDFGANSLRSTGINNPYAPAPKTDADSGASPTAQPNILDNRLSGSAGRLQGIDPDQRK